MPAYRHAVLHLCHHWDAGLCSCFAAIDEDNYIFEVILSEMLTSGFFKHDIVNRFLSVSAAGVWEH